MAPAKGRNGAASTAILTPPVASKILEVLAFVWLFIPAFVRFWGQGCRPWYPLPNREKILLSTLL